MHTCLLHVQKSPCSKLMLRGYAVMTSTCSSEVGGKRVCKDRAPQPGGRFVPSVRAACSVIHVESGIKCGRCPLPFSRLGAISLFPSGCGRLPLFACLPRSCPVLAGLLGCDLMCPPIIEHLVLGLSVQPLGCTLVRTIL